MFSGSSVRRRVRLLITAVGMLAIAVGVTANFESKRASALSEDVDKYVGEISGAVEFAKRADIEVDTPDDQQDSAVLRNVRVDQDRSNFPHDETVIAVNPRNPKNLVAGANDYRLGYGASGFYSSQDGGHTWYDGIAPIPAWPDGNVPAGG